jgi:hypothetical protein
MIKLGIAGIINVMGAAGLLGSFSKVKTAAMALLTLDWSDLKTQVTNIGSKLADWVTSLNAKNIKDAIKGMGASMTKFAGTVIGSAVIIGAALWAAFELSAKGVDMLGFQYKGFWEQAAGVTLDFVIGIIGTILSIGAAIIAIGEIIVKSFFNIGQAAIKALLAGIKGEDPEQAFFDAMTTIDFGEIFKKNFEPIIALGEAGVIIKEGLGLIEPMETQKPVQEAPKILIMTPTEALASGEIDNNTYETLIQAGFLNQKVNISPFITGN